VIPQLAYLRRYSEFDQSKRAMDQNRIFAFILFLGALLGIGGVALLLLGVPAIAAVMLNLGYITCIYMLARLGTTVKTVYFRVIAICLALYVVGLLLRMYGQPFGTEAQVVSLAGIAVAYFLSSIKKPKLLLPDWLKLGFTVGYSICTILVIYNLFPAILLYSIGILLFIAAIIVGLDLYRQSKLEE